VTSCRHVARYFWWIY